MQVLLENTLFPLLVIPTSIAVSPSSHFIDAVVMDSGRLVNGIKSCTVAGLGKVALDVGLTVGLGCKRGAVTAPVAVAWMVGNPDKSNCFSCKQPARKTKENARSAKNSFFTILFTTQNFKIF